MIVVVGEALVDLVPSGADQLTVHCGGSPFDTARALARLGQPVSFLGCISEDSLGQRLRGALRADGVGLDGVIATRLPTTRAFAQLDAGASARHEFYTEVTVIDTIGAGDAFSAGFLAWRRHHGLGRADLPDLDRVAEAARFACQVAGRTVERAGATPPRMRL